MNKCHLVDMLSEVRENRRDHLAALAPGSELKRGLHQVPDRVAKKTSGVRKRRVKLLDRLAVGFLKSRFVVPSIDLAGTSVDKNPNDSLGPRCEMGLAFGKRIPRTIAESIAESIT
jgi:hypothetical protein